MDKILKDPAIPEEAAKSEGSGYRHYLEMIKVLVKLRRKSDLEFGPKLMNKILDARHQNLISDEQAMELTDRIQAWVQKLENNFASQEYQMKKLMLAIELEERRSGERSSNL
jgi:hypothetical protein